MRQGDIMLVQIDELPKNLKERKDKVLAYGEVTGHSHRFRNPQVLVFENPNGEKFVELQQEEQLIHEEHETIKVPKGKYKVIQQREYDLHKGIRQVMD